jgi:hypothetical protein
MVSISPAARERQIALAIIGRVVALAGEIRYRRLGAHEASVLSADGCGTRATEGEE